MKRVTGLQPFFTAVFVLPLVTQHRFFAKWGMQGRIWIQFCALIGLWPLQQLHVIAAVSANR
jgi:hypothetical protein